MPEPTPKAKGPVVKLAPRKWDGGPPIKSLRKTTECSQASNSPNASPAMSSRKRPHQDLVDNFGVTWVKKDDHHMAFEEDMRDWVPNLSSQKGLSSKGPSPEKTLMAKVEEENPYSEHRPDTPPETNTD